MDRPTIYWLINGIMNWPGCPGNWNKKGVTWLHLHAYPCAAQTDEYFTTAITAPIHAKRRAEDFADLLDQFKEWRQVAIAHSNGTKVLLDAQKISHWVRMEAIHLVSGACDADFQRNGLNWAVKNERIGDIYYYIAGHDIAMRFEDTMTGKALFGLYPKDKPLGLSGPTNVDPMILGRVHPHREPAYGHSDWWLPKNFDLTMSRFVLC